jgi:hypothetical protein
LLIDQLLERAQCSWLVQAAFVATDGGHAAYIFERRAAFFALVTQAISRDQGILVIAHQLILNLVG